MNTIDRRILTPLVSDALNGPVEIVEWGYEPVHGGFGAFTGEGLYRFSGRGKRSERPCEWSLILKIIRADSDMASDGTTTWNYWKREALAYQSGMLDEIPGRLAAPRCFGVQEISADEIWIWLEEIPAETDKEWPLDRYRVAAEHLGQFNGAYLVNRSLPSREWFSNGRIHEWLADAEDAIPRLEEYLPHPFVRVWLPDDVPDRLKRLWLRKGDLLGGIADLPRTLCHHDAFRRNLMSGRDRDGHEITVALDWSMLGQGVIGEEIATMFSVSLQFLDFDARFAPRLDAAIYQGYLAGLRSAGWLGREELVRFGFTASAALFMGLGAAGSYLLWLVDDDNYAILEEFLGQPLDKVAAQWSIMQRYLHDLGDEALALLERIR